jgi:hypothetical protein
VKKLIVFVIAIMFLLAPLANAGSDSGPMGPAPNSGDGISDGSGFDGANGPNSVENQDVGIGPVGPAPNSGDCIPDGSGFDVLGGTIWEDLMF